DGKGGGRSVECPAAAPPIAGSARAGHPTVPRARDRLIRAPRRSPLQWLAPGDSAGRAIAEHAGDQRYDTRAAEQQPERRSVQRNHAADEHQASADQPGRTLPPANVLPIPHGSVLRFVTRRYGAFTRTEGSNPAPG